MTIIVKIHGKGQMTLPAKLRRLAGIGEDDLVRAEFKSDRILITPTLVVERPTLLKSGDDYKYFPGC